MDFVVGYRHYLYLCFSEQIVMNAWSRAGNRARNAQILLVHTNVNANQGFT